MGFQKTMLLAVAFFVGSFAQPEQACGPEMTAPYVPNSLSTSTIAPSSKRFLRPYDTAAWDTVDSEEKAGASLLSKLDDLKQKISKFSSSVEKANIKARLKSQVHPSDLLGTLRLGNGTAKLDDNPNLVQWFRLVEAYRAKNGEQAFSNFDMYFLLLKTNSPEQLKTLPESLEKIPGLKKISESMKNWLKSPESPEKVFNDLRLAKANMDAFGDNSMLIQWFRKAKPLQSEWELAALFQSLKEVPDLKSLAGNMQTNLYQKWFSMKFNPKEVDEWLGILYSSGGKSVMENVKTYLTSADPIKIDGLTAAMKAE
ncbi:hypothetical protein PI124_g20590 [Phytophthora idaei]|nr:hypothetical protein PI124_g20590 [Phytophthora idaei]